MAQIKTGKITQVIGAILDVRYKEGELPQIYDALEIVRADGTRLVVEVAQQLGDVTLMLAALRDVLNHDVADLPDRPGHQNYQYNEAGDHQRLGDGM